MFWRCREPLMKPTLGPGRDFSFVYRPLHVLLMLPYKYPFVKSARLHSANCLPPKSLCGARNRTANEVPPKAADAASKRKWHGGHKTGTGIKQEPPTEFSTTFTRNLRSERSCDDAGRIEEAIRWVAGRFTLCDFIANGPMCTLPVTARFGIVLSRCTHKFCCINIDVCRDCFCHLISSDLYGHIWEEFHLTFPSHETGCAFMLKELKSCGHHHSFSFSLIF